MTLTAHPAVTRPLALVLGLALAGLAHKFDVLVRISCLDALHFLVSAVLAMAFDENNLNVIAELRKPLHRRLNVPALIARGNDHRH